MDSSPPSPQAPLSATTSKRRRALWRFLAVGVSLLAILVALLLAFASPSSRFDWLTPAQIAQANHPGLLTRLKFKMIRLAGPLIRFYHPKRPNILIAIIIVRSSSTGGPAQLGAPLAGNGDRPSAWIIPPERMDSLRQNVRKNPSIFFLAAPSIQTSSGTPTTANMTHPVAVAPGIYTNVGITLDATASASSGSIKLLLNTADTQFSRPLANRGAVTTNFSAACRATLPDGGGLVINCKNTDLSNPTSFWVIVSPALVDATGQPIKH